MDINENVNFRIATNTSSFIRLQGTYGLKKCNLEVLKTVNDHGSVLINASGHVFGKKINSIVSYSSTRCRLRSLQAY